MTSSRIRPMGVQDNPRSEEHTSELQSHVNLVCRLLLEKKKKIIAQTMTDISTAFRTCACERIGRLDSRTLLDQVRTPLAFVETDWQGLTRGICAALRA